jgi:hypothetical protein
MTAENPLSKYYRQPSVYITLPSKGRYYDSTVLKTTETGELPVLPMNAKDELTFKTPDAMMSGQATVDVIKSCIPNILDPWRLVNYDLDTVLLAIRIASYGESMDVTFNVPVINEKVSHSVNLPALLESVTSVSITDEAKTTAGFVIKFRPLTFKEITKNQVAAFQQQKTYANVLASSATDEEKSKKFAESFKALTDLNFDVLLNGIESITTPDGDTVTDSKTIDEFISNSDSRLVTEIQDKLTQIRAQASFKPLSFKSTEEQINKGAPVNYEVPLTFDNSNFFG